MARVLVGNTHLPHADDARTQLEPVRTPRGMLAVERALNERASSLVAAEANAEQTAAALTARGIEADQATTAAAVAAAAAARSASDQASHSEATRAAEQAAAAQAAAAAAASDAQAAAQKLNVELAAATASAGVYCLVYEHGWRRIALERYATKADALLVASTLWWCWVAYHEQRGAFTEVASGGLGRFAQPKLRRHVEKMTQQGMNFALSGHASYPSIS